MFDKVVKLEISVSTETAQDVEILFAEKGWEPDDGLRLLIGAALAAVRATDSQTPGDETAYMRMANRLGEVERDLAVLRFRMFEMQESNQAWELSTGAIRNQNIGFQAIIKRQKEEIESLEAHNARLQAQINAVQAVSEEQHARQPIQPEQKSFWNKIRGK